MALRREPAPAGHGAKEPAIADSHREPLEPEGAQRLRRREDQLDLGDLRRDTEDVDVALGELPVTAPLRTLGAPDGSDLHCAERLRQLPVVVGIVPGERHREIEPEAEVGEVRLGGDGAEVQLLPALEHLEDQLLVVAAPAAGEQLQALQGRRLDAAESVPAIHGEDRPGRRVAQLRLGGQDVPHAARRLGREPSRHRDRAPSA